MSALERCAPISLAELNAAAALQTRVDRKYVVPRDRVAAVLHRLPDARVLDIDGRRRFGYSSLYFDTPELESYHRAAYGRRRRFKIRTRHYLDTAACYLEVKTSGARSATVKERLEYRVADRGVLTEPGLAYTREVLHDAGIDGVDCAALRPTITTRYDRSTLYLPGSQSRATVDTELTWVLPDGAVSTRPDAAIVETKSGSRAGAADRALWAEGFRPVSVSKFATGLALVHDHLPHTRWVPVLRNQLSAPTPERNPHD